MTSIFLFYSFYVNWGPKYPAGHMNRILSTDIINYYGDIGKRRRNKVVPRKKTWMTNFVHI